jgi:hypothetical protein
MSDPESTNNVQSPTLVAVMDSVRNVLRSRKLHLMRQIGGGSRA